ncbi:hypothetical protein DSO57_1003451 [Entomophthora muscae]|uniref:Uncharacterized protein n=1 Tax=Entomophthora muscae TaxID=34485 RepID=A0ACC2UU78_9FUNG|nr:hypothetical protein DSO57_1003451 [Entomophthora muscae]
MLHYMAQKGLIFTLDDEEDGPASLTRWAYDIDDAPIKETIKKKTTECEKKRKTTRYSNKELPPKGTKDKIWFSEFPKATKALRTIQRKEEAIPCTNVTFKFQCRPGSTTKGGQLECAKLRANITELTDNNDITKLDDDKMPSIAKDFYINYLPKVQPATRQEENYSICKNPS